jgi:uncharacterized protein (TIGR02996 family)
MSLADSFLEDIVANPDDDGPRLVYADWLDEHGDSTRAEFIRLQFGNLTYDQADPSFILIISRGPTVGRRPVGERKGHDRA